MVNWPEFNTHFTSINDLPGILQLSKAVRGDFYSFNSSQVVVGGAEVTICSLPIIPKPGTNDRFFISVLISGTKDATANQVDIFVRQESGTGIIYLSNNRASSWCGANKSPALNMVCTGLMAVGGTFTFKLNIQSLGGNYTVNAGTGFLFVTHYNGNVDAPIYT